MTIADGKSKKNEDAILRRIEESGGSVPPSGIMHRNEAKQITIDRGDAIRSVAFLAEGKYAVSGGMEGKIRCWRMEDGQEVGTPMDVGSPICNIAVSRDGRWIVCGTKNSSVTVWDAESYEKVTEFKDHAKDVRAVDISPDATRIATGSDDKTACIWSLSTGQRLLGPLEHESWVVAAKFSPDGCLLATATWKRDSIRIYNSHDNCVPVDVSIQVNSIRNNSLAWTSDGKQLFALSLDGKIHCLDKSTGTTLVKWPIHSNDHAKCIALASNGKLVAASAARSVSLWDTTTQEQVGSIIELGHDVWSMAISTNCDLATSGDKIISLRSLHDRLSSSYFDDASVLSFVG